MNQEDAEILKHRLEALPGLRCWYVSCGGCIQPTFELAFGEKIRRAIPLKNQAQSEDFRHFEPEYGLLVWCTWRLDGEHGPLSSSDDQDETIVRELERLKGAAVQTVELREPAWDLTVGFSNGLTLQVFCDHVPGDPSFDGNWEIWTPEEGLCVGPGRVLYVEPAAKPLSPAAASKA